MFDLVFNRDKEERATAIIAGTDYTAGLILQYVKKLGLKVPEDLAVVGMDNTYLTEILSPQLTSVDFSKEVFAQKLVDTMLKLLRGEKAENQFIDASLCVRDSA